MHPLLVHAPSDALRCTLMEKEVRAATAISSTITITSTSTSAPPACQREGSFTKEFFAGVLARRSLLPS